MNTPISSDSSETALRRSVTPAQIALMGGALLLFIIVGYSLLLRLTRPAIPQAKPVEMPAVVQGEYQGEPEPVSTPGTPGQLTHEDELRQEKLQMLKNSAMEAR